jgi:hypothetical protein
MRITGEDGDGIRQAKKTLRRFCDLAGVLGEDVG